MRITQGNLLFTLVKFKVTEELAVVMSTIGTNAGVNLCEEVWMVL